jgi:hypothetical protein
MVGASFQPLISYGAAAAPLALTYLQSTTDTGNESTEYEFTSVNFGVADATRVVIVGVSLSANSVTLGATIGGVTATLVAQVHTGGNVAELWAAAVPTGTSGTVTITLDDSGARIRIHTFRMVNGNATATFANSNTNGSGSTSIAVTVPAGGAGIGITANNSGGTGFSWTNGTEVDDTNVESGGLRAGAATIAASATVSVTGASAAQAMVAAAWGA